MWNVFISFRPERKFPEDLFQLIDSFRFMKQKVTDNDSKEEKPKHCVSNGDVFDKCSDTHREDTHENNNNFCFHFFKIFISVTYIEYKITQNKSLL